MAINEAPSSARNPYESPLVSSDQQLNLEDNAHLNSARRKAYVRLLPLLFICYIVAYIDRTNVSFASLTMMEDLPAFTKKVFGIGAGIFFIGYFLLEIPGSIIVERWSARKWICRIMLTWGVVAALTAFVKTPNQFYFIRFLLGVAEAGFFPGVIVYLTHWFPSKDRARALALFLVASPIAMIIGPPISSLFIEYGRNYELDGKMIHNPLLLGLEGWQWIYIFWGIPAVVMGLVVLKYLIDRPRDAKWLTPAEQEALENELARERASLATTGHMSVLQALTSAPVVLLSLAYFGIVTANYGIEFFLGHILKEWYALQPAQIAWLLIVPSIYVIPGQLFIGWSSDKFSERRWHSVIPVVAGAIALVAAAYSNSTLTLTMVCFTIAAMGMKIYMPAFWSLPSVFLTASAAAGSIGMINSVGNLGGFLGPFVLGYLHEQWKSFDYGLYFIAVTSLISSAIISFMRFNANK